MAEAGADIIEIGLPYSDPIMDGPVIAEAVLPGADRRHPGRRRAGHRRGGRRYRHTRPGHDLLEPGRPVRRARVRPRPGPAGGCGADHARPPPEEAGPWLEASDEYGSTGYSSAAPSSTDERIATIARYCRGFVYAASLMGTTGTRDAVSADAAGLVLRISEHTDLPVAVGLGVRNGAQAAQVAAFADGVIVGTAFVRRSPGRRPPPTRPPGRGRGPRPRRRAFCRSSGKLHLRPGRGQAGNLARCRLPRSRAQPMRRGG